MIDWQAFSWEAFATLATGFAAVIAAYRVGKRQIGISERQTEIQDRQAGILAKQVRLQELTLASDLYDRRIVVFEVTERYLADLATMLDYHADNDVRTAFVRSMSSAKFLFDPKVHRFQLMISKLSFKGSRIKSKLDAMDRGKSGGMEDLFDQREAFYDEITFAQRSIPVVFSELYLGVVSDSEEDVEQNGV